MAQELDKKLEKSVHELEEQLDDINPSFLSCKANSKVGRALINALQDAYTLYHPSPLEKVGYLDWGEAAINIFRRHYAESAQMFQDLQNNRKLTLTRNIADQGQIETARTIFPTPQNRLERFVVAQAHLQKATDLFRLLNTYREADLDLPQDTKLLIRRHPTHFLSPEEGLEQQAEDHLGAAAQLFMLDINIDLLNLTEELSGVKD